jgi:hypothetical protein
MATRWLDNLGGSAEFTVSDDTPAAAGTANAFGLTVLEHRGSFAYRPAADDLWLAGSFDEDGPQRGVRVVRTAPAAP